MKQPWTPPLIVGPLDGPRLLTESLQKLHDVRKKLKEATVAAGASR